MMFDKHKKFIFCHKNGDNNLLSKSFGGNKSFIGDIFRQNVLLKI